MTAAQAAALDFPESTAVEVPCVGMLRSVEHAGDGHAAQIPPSPQIFGIRIVLIIALPLNA